MADEVELHWTEIDGVKTVWVDTHRPLTAALLFRAGSAHETLVTSGRTHLLEHMALYGVPSTPDRFNGAVAGAFTHFATTDNPDGVCAFFQAVTRALCSLPAGRLDQEKKILEAESERQSYSTAGNLLLWRYGAAGYGLLGMPEFGLREATMDQLNRLAAERFTAENAVLWLSGPPPADLRLDLPHGVKQPLPALKPVLTSYPSWFRDDRTGGAAASAILPRVSAVSLFNLILQKRIYQRLRQELTLSYSPALAYDPLDATSAELIIHADAKEDRRDELVDALAEFFEKLVEIDEAEVEAARAETLEHWVGPLAPPLEDEALGEVQRAAFDWVMDMPHESTAQLADGVRAVTLEDVAALRRAVYNTALFALPGNPSERPIDAKPAPASLTPAVEGRQISHKDAPVNLEKLVIAAEGVTWQPPKGRPLTVRYSDLAAALTYKDGIVQLIGTDAGCVTVEPTLWRDGPRVCKEIRERVPGGLLLDRGARPADAIPKPETKLWQRANAWITPHRQQLAYAVIVLVMCAIAIQTRQLVLIPVLIISLMWAWRLMKR